MSRHSARVHARAFLSQRFLAALFCLSILVSAVYAQETIPVPRLVKIAGTISGAPTGTVGVIFALYKDQTGGAPLWQEVQNVIVDQNGRYGVYLGARSATGLPLDVFSNGEAHWLGVQPDGQPEQVRVLLVSVPYALKASDAETLGGLPASAFLRADSGSTAHPAAYINTAAVTAVANLISAQAIIANGATAGSIPMFTDLGGDLVNSALFQSLSGNVGLGTTTPAALLNLVGANPTMRIDNYSDNVGDSPNFNFLTARGTAASPSATQNGDNLGQFAAAGYNGSGFPGSRVKVTFIATENWTPTANGTAMSFQTTTNGSTARAERLRIDNTGYVGIGTSTPTSPLTVAGAIQSTSGGFKFPDGSTQTSATTTGVASVAAADSSVIMGGTPTAPTVAVNTQTIQKRIGYGCPGGQAVVSVNADGSVGCVLVTGGSGGSTNNSQYLPLFGPGDSINDPGSVGGAGARLHTDQALTVTNVTYAPTDPGVGACTPALARLTNDNGTIYEDIPIPIPTTTYITADHEIVFPANSDISISLVQAAYCGNDYVSGPPRAFSGSVRYRVSNTGDSTSCPPNLTLYNGSCVDTQSDSFNCGTAGHACPAIAGNFRAACSNGFCASTGTCKGGYGDCDGNPANGCETNLSNDVRNCGYCGGSCQSISNGTAVCSNSACQVSCSSGFQQCFAGCTKTSMDPNNCGTCGNVCSPGQQCSNSVCVGGSGGSTLEVFVSPSSLTLGFGQTRTFSASVSNGSTAVTWSVQEGTSGGTINSSGGYSAPGITGIYHVVATSQADARAKAIATVSVVNNAPLPPIFTSTPPLTAILNQPYTYTLSAIDPAGGSVTFQLLGSNGSITGNVMTAYNYYNNYNVDRGFSADFTVIATTTSGGTASQSWTVTVGGNITGTEIDTYISESGNTVKVPRNFSSDVPLVLVPDSVGGYTTLSGYGQSNGQFTVPNVPPGGYLLWDDSYLGYWETANSIDISSTNLGRSDVVYPSGTVNLNPTITGLVSTQTGDLVQYYAPNVGYSSTRTPATGLTSWTDTFSWGGGLLDGTRDNLYVTQLSSAVVNGYTMQSAKKFSGPLHVTTPDSATTSFNVPLNDVPQSSSFPVNIKASAFAALRSSTNPSATPGYSYLLVQANPLPAAYSSAQLLRFRSSPPLNTDINLGNVAYGNPFPGYVSYYSYYDYSTVSYTAPGATTSAPYSAGTYIYSNNFPTASSPIVPLVGPPTQPLINATSLFTTQTLNTTMPTLSWSAPSVGTPTEYAVYVMQLYANTGQTLFNYVGFLQTTQNSILLPPNLLAAGNTYVFIVMAECLPNTAPTDYNGGSFPIGFGELLSAPITISPTAITPAITGTSGPVSSQSTNAVAAAAVSTNVAAPARKLPPALLRKLQRLERLRNPDGGEASQGIALPNK